MQQLKKLFEPIRVGKVDLKNRLVLSALSLYLTPGCLVSKRLENFYIERARGGVGLILCTFAALKLAHGGPWKDYQPSIYENKQIPAIHGFVNAIHAAGAKVGIQLYCPADWSEESVGPSAVPVLREHLPPITPRELAVEEIHQTVGRIGDAIRRAREAGFDLVQLHAIGGECFLSRFLAPVTNRRTDEYGGSLENRLRVVLDVLADGKKKAGEDYTIIIKITGDAFREGAPTLEEQKVTASILEKAGFEALEIKPGWRGQRVSTTLQPEGAFVYLAEEIKKMVNIPVITGTRYVSPVLANRVISEGKADMVSMARALIADPELPNKARDGRLNEIRPCIACQFCIDNINKAEAIACACNVQVGNEGDVKYVITVAPKSKKVLIVGGGPAGMETARVAAKRGHEVILYEKEPKLGGLLPLAAMVKGLVFQDFVGLCRYLKTQVSISGVKVELGKEATPAVIEDIKPDVVVLSVGGVLTTPDVPGINNKNLISAATLHRKVKPFLRFFGPKLLRWLTKFWIPIGRRVIIMGGSIHGLETAEFMVKRGREVTIVEDSDELGALLLDPLRRPLLDWLAKKGVTMQTGVTYEEITDKGLVITTKEGKRQLIKGDNVLVTLPTRPNTELFKTIEGKVPEVYLAGDCREGNLIMGAIHDGYHIGCSI